MIAMPDTNRQVSVYDSWLARTKLTDVEATRPNVPVLGSGSDYTAFVQVILVEVISFRLISNRRIDISIAK